MASIWRYEYQNQNAQEIARQGGALYDKFVGFAANLEKLGKQLDSARDSFGDAMKQLSSGRGNLVASAERLRKLGCAITSNCSSILNWAPRKSRAKTRSANRFRTDGSQLEMTVS